MLPICLFTIKKCERKCHFWCAFVGHLVTPKYLDRYRSIFVAAEILRRWCHSSCPSNPTHRCPDGNVSVMCRSACIWMFWLCPFTAISGSRPRVPYQESRVPRIPKKAQENRTGRRTLQKSCFTFVSWPRTLDWSPFSGCVSAQICTALNSWDNTEAQSKKRWVRSSSSRDTKKFCLGYKALKKASQDIRLAVRRIEWFLFGSRAKLHLSLYRFYVATARTSLGVLEMFTLSLMQRNCTLLTYQCLIVPIYFSPKTISLWSERLFEFSHHLKFLNSAGILMSEEV